jgi:transposase
MVMEVPSREALLQMPPTEAIGLLLGIIADLQRQLAERSLPPKNSSNSSLPPAAAPAPRTRSLRRRSGRPSGGQPGHPGQTRCQVLDPTVIRHLRPEHCGDCGLTLSPTLHAFLVERRQVVEIPPVQAITIEYQQHAVACPSCDALSLGAFPEGVTASVQCGPRLQAHSVYLKEVQHLSYERTQETLADLFGTHVSEGTLTSVSAQAAERGRPDYEALRQEVLASAVIGSDETGQRVGGRRRWLWVFRTALVTYFVAAVGRSGQVIEQMLGGLQTAAVWVSDRWKPQLRVQAAGGHQLCLPHLLRDLQYSVDAYRSAWAYRLQQLLHKALALRKRCDERMAAGEDCWVQPKGMAWRQRVVANLEARLAAALTAPTTHQPDRKMQKSLAAYRCALTVFLHRADVPSDNNGSERDLRPEKVHQKVIGCYRSKAGAEQHALLLSLVQTARKRKQNVLARLMDLLGRPEALQVTYSLQEGAG